VRPLGLLGKLHIRNDEPDVVLRLEDEAHRQVAAYDADKHLHRLGQPGPQSPLRLRDIDHQVEYLTDPVRHYEADDQAEKRPGKRRQRLPRNQDIHRQRRDSHPESREHREQRIGFRQLVARLGVAHRNPRHRQQEEHTKNVQNHDLPSE